MTCYPIVAAVWLAVVLAQDFGDFVLKSQLTTYSNTLLDATVFILPTDEPSAPAPSSTLSNTVAPSSATQASFAIAPSSSTSISADTQFSTSSSSVSAGIASSTSGFVSAFVPASIVDTTTSTASVSSSLASPTSAFLPTPFISPHQTSVASSKDSCTPQSVLIWETSVATATVLATSTSTVRLYKTAHFYANWTNATNGARTSISAAENVVTITTTSCISSFSTPPISLPSASSRSSVGPAPYVSPSLPSQGQPSRLPSPTVTQTQSMACGGEVVTTTVYQLPPLGTLFTANLNGTDVLVLNVPQSTDAKPAWPFYENPQWDFLETRTDKPGPVPKRQQIPSQQATNSFESKFARRHISLESTDFVQSTVVVTITCSGTTTSYPSTSGSNVPNAISAATIHRSVSSIHNAPVSSTAAPNPSSTILGAGMHQQPIASSKLNSFSTLSATSLSSTGRDTAGNILSWLESVFLGGPASTTAPASPAATTTTTDTVTATPAAVTATVTVSPTSITPSVVTVATVIDTILTAASEISTHTTASLAVPATVSSFTLNASSTAETVEGPTGLPALPHAGTCIQSSSLLVSYPATVSTLPQAWTATTSSQDSTRDTSAQGLPLTVVPKFSPTVRATEATAPGVSSATSSLAFYGCAPWTSGNDVLLCHINSQSVIKPPLRMLVIFISIVAAVFVLVI